MVFSPGSPLPLPRPRRSRRSRRPSAAGLLRWLRRRLIWLWRHEGSHGQRARGLAAGIFTGCYPFFGLQIVLGVGLASVLRGNHILAAAGTWISNPVTSLPLYWFNYQVGSWLLGPGPGFPTLSQVREAGLWDLGLAFTSRLMLGSTLVGLASALGFGALYWLWLNRTSRRSQA